MALLVRVTAQAVAKKGQIFMATTPLKMPKNLGPPEQKKSNTPNPESQLFHSLTVKSSQNLNPQNIPKEILEAQEKLTAKRVSMPTLSPGPVQAGSIQEDFERLKAAAIRSGRFDQATSVDAAPKVSPKKKASGSRKGKRHSDFQEAFPKVFKTWSTWLVFDYVWRFAKKTRTGQLRWEGYMTIVAKDIGISFSTVQRSFKKLEAAGIFHRWNTGKKFPGNISSGSGPAYHHTVVTVAWSPSYLAWKKRADRKAARKGSLP